MLISELPAFQVEVRRKRQCFSEAGHCQIIQDYVFALLKSYSGERFAIKMGKLSCLVFISLLQ